jgi:hypothetical protein
MRARVDHARCVSVRKYEKYYEHTIKSYDFQLERLVLVRFTQFEKTVSSKMKARYLGPMVVIRRTKGGVYLVAEMNSAMFQERIAVFRVIHYEARHGIQIPANIQQFIDISEETLAKLADDDSNTSRSKVSKKYKGKDLYRRQTFPDSGMVDSNYLI